MTKLRDELARAIYDADPATYFRDKTVVSWEEAPPPYKDGAYKSAQAVLDHLAPMLDEVEEALESCVSVIAYLDKWCDHPDAEPTDVDFIRQALTKLQARKE